MTGSPDVYITANPTPNPDALKFIVDRQLVDGNAVSYPSVESAEGSPLAEKLFALGGVKQLFAYQNFVTVTRDSDQPWQDFARGVGQTIRGHIQGGGVEHFTAPKLDPTNASDEKVAIIESVLDEIRPMVAQDGGNIVFAGYQDGVVSLMLQGSCAGCPSSTITLKQGIETRLREVMPEIQDVVSI